MGSSAAGVAGAAAAAAAAAGLAVVTVEGGRAELPCDISAPARGDSVYLVLWYRKNFSGTPIYRYVHMLDPFKMRLE